jgi:hypothetical protein
VLAAAAAVVCALLAAHLAGALPSLASAAPAAAFVAGGGNLGLGTLWRETAAFFASVVPHETVSIGVTAAASAASGGVGYAAAARAARLRMERSTRRPDDSRVAVGGAAEDIDVAVVRDEIVASLGTLEVGRDAGAASGAASGAAAAGGVSFTTAVEPRVGSEPAGAGDARATDGDRASKLAELAELRLELARVRAVWSPRRDLGAADAGDANDAGRAGTGAEATAAEHDPAGAAAAAAASSRSLDPRGRGFVPSEGPDVSVDYAAVAKARALWSPRAPGDESRLGAAPHRGESWKTRDALSRVRSGIAPIEPPSDASASAESDRE